MEDLEETTAGVLEDRQEEEEELDETEEEEEVDVFL